MNKSQSQTIHVPTKISYSDEGEAPLKRKLTVTLGPDGAPVASWMFVLDENDMVGQTSDLSREELLALGDKTLKSLAQQGVQTSLPDVQE